MNKELIEKQIRELDTDNLITKIFIEGVKEGREIDYYFIGCKANDYDEIDIVYRPEFDRLVIATNNTIYYDDKDPLPLFVFAYNNKDKIKSIIKENINNE